MLESGTLFEITDRQFDDGVTTVIGVERHRITVAVGDEGVVGVGEKECGPWLVQLGAAHSESVLVAVRGLAHPGTAVRRVVD